MIPLLLAMRESMGCGGSEGSVHFKVTPDPYYIALPGFSGQISLFAKYRE